MSGETITDVVRGAIKLDSYPESCFFTSWDDFLRALPRLLTVEVPNSITNVWLSSQQPGDDRRDNLWIRIDTAGSFVGLYVYGQGAWQLISPAPQQIIRMYGRSDQLPTGYVLADSNNPHMTVAMATALEATWTWDPTHSYYVIFDVTFEGF